MKKRKMIISTVLLVSFVVTAGVGYYFVHSQKASAAVSSQEIVLEEGQELLYAKITSISGNEMEYAVLEAQMVDLEEMGNGRGRNKSEQNTGDRSDDGEMPPGGGRTSNDGMSSNNEASFGNGMSSNGEVPSGIGAPFEGGMSSNREMPSGDGGAFMAEIPSGGQNGKLMNSRVLSDNQNGRDLDENPPEDMQNRTITTYKETGKTGQIQIPVGTDVETKLGTITTFSRLSNGDTIRMLMQKADNSSEDLLKIWIVE